MRTFVPLLLALTAAAQGCDSPSGGGVDCARIPTDPRCRPDTSGLGDGTVTDSGGEVSSETCSTGARRCQGDTPEVCQASHWVSQTACGADETCTNGSCVEKSPDTCCVDMECGNDCGRSCGTCGANETCDASSQCVPSSRCVPACAGRECGPDGCGGSCGGCNVGQSCQAGLCISNQTCDCQGAECGEDNCGNSCGICGQNQTCVAGECELAAAGDDCVALVDCIFDPTGCVQIEDEAAFQVCADACYAAASTVAQGEFDAYLGCANTCGTDDICFLDECSDEQATCFFSRQGTGNCADILDCFQFCADGDSACIFACYEQSSTTAQAQLLALNGCLNLECPEDSPSQTCIDEALLGACADYATPCL